MCFINVTISLQSTRLGKKGVAENIIKCHQGTAIHIQPSAGFLKVNTHEALPEKTAFAGFFKHRNLYGYAAFPALHSFLLTTRKQCNHRKT